ncbi:ABC transporter substrate-binding protein [Burkholderiaceae bacterium DAT-1]|nr:ABC transporter substrate-binding protein [Burkholderiaceae bacterium DAT-1]
MNHTALRAGLIGLATLFSIAAQADQLADIRKKGELIVGVLGSDEPNSFIDPATREIVGYDVDLARAIAQKIGVKLTIKPMSVAARIPELTEGRVDLLAASLTHTKEREAKIDFSLTTLVTGQKVMVRKDSGVTALPQLAGKKVVTVKGGTQEINFRAAVPNANLVTFDTTGQALIALRQGKGVAYVNDEFSIIDDFAKLGPQQKDFQVLDKNLSVEPIALGLRKNEPGFRALVNDTLKQLEASGNAEQLFLKWYGPTTRLKVPKRSFKIETDKV